MRQPRWLHDICPLTVNFLSFLALSLLAFRINQVNLLAGLDGSYFLTLAKHQFQWTTFALGFTNDFIESNGNIAFPVNFHLVPGYILGRLAGGPDINRWVCYSAAASELFLGTYVLSRALQLPALTATLAAWAMPLLSLPYVNWPLLYPVYLLIPHLSTAVAEALLIFACFRRVGRSGSLPAAAWATGIFLIAAHMIASATLCSVGGTSAAAFRSGLPHAFRKPP